MRSIGPWACVLSVTALAASSGLGCGTRMKRLETGERTDASAPSPVLANQESSAAGQGADRAPAMPATSLASAVSPPAPFAVLVEGEDHPYHIAVDDRYVYWTTNQAVRRAPRDGGPAMTLATGAGISAIAVAAPTVAFIDGPAGKVAWVDREGSPIHLIGSGQTPAQVAVRDGMAYWTNSGDVVGGADDSNGSLAVGKLAGGAVRLLREHLISPVGIALDDQFVYFTSPSVSCGPVSAPIPGAVSVRPSPAAPCVGGGVWKLPLTDGDPVAIDTRDTPLDVVVGEHGVYWLRTPGVNVVVAPKDGGAPRILATVQGEINGPIALDEDAFYFSSSDRGRVIRVPFSGGTSERIATDLGGISGIAVDDRFVYVAATETGRILRVAKDGSARMPMGPITGPCPMRVGTTREVASTPRADVNLELLALHIDAGHVVATQETYERVIADVAALRKLAPELADIPYFAPHDGRGLLLSVSDMTALSIEAGEYSAWQCLNDFYGRTSMQLERFDDLGVRPLVTVTLKGIYDINAVGALYGQLPGVRFEGPPIGGGGGPTLCGVRAGADIEYVVDRASGDCLLGCTEHEAHHFRSTAPGQLTALETWSGGSGASAPEWLRRTCAK